MVSFTWFADDGAKIPQFPAFEVNVRVEYDEHHDGSDTIKK